MLPPWLSTAWRAHPATRERRRIFEGIIRENVWGDPESVSGPGSNAARAALFRPAFEALVHDLAVHTLLDIPCGDFNWIGDFDLPIQRYIGADIIPALIAHNRARSHGRRQRFVVADMVCDALPRADLILCRDGLVHLSHNDIFATLKNFKRSRSTWLLTSTFVGHPENIDIATGGWRTLNLQTAPFNFPPPVRMIDEQCLGYGGAYRDKRLALWQLEALPFF